LTFRLGIAGSWLFFLGGGGGLNCFICFAGMMQNEARQEQRQQPD
jgi:hypothetical protein